MSMLCRGWAHIQNYSKAEILSQDRPGVAAQAPFEPGLAAAAEHSRALIATIERSNEFLTAENRR